MYVTVKTDIKISSDNIKIGEYTLSEIFRRIHENTLQCVQEISIERQSEKPNLEDIDTPLHNTLNFLEEIRGY